MPEFQSNEPEHQEWKQKVLSGDIELAEIDTTPYQNRFGKNSVQADTIRNADAADWRPLVLDHGINIDFD